MIIVGIILIVVGIYLAEYLERGDKFIREYCGVMLILVGVCMAIGRLMYGGLMNGMK